MAEVFTSDNSVPAEVMNAELSDQAESLQIGEELVAQHEARLAGKYKTTEELESAYLELQKKLGSQEEDVQAEPEQTTEVDWLAEAQQAISESGELSEELTKQISEMNSMDVFNAMKDSSFSEAVDLTDSQLNTVFNAVGGEEAYGELVNWAQNNFSQAEIEAYDQVIDTGNMGQISLALQALQYRYSEAMGQDGNMLQGKPAAAEETFRSQAELIRAMNDPRYDEDEAYRMDVIKKLERSDLTF